MRRLGFKLYLLEYEIDHPDPSMDRCKMQRGLFVLILVVDVSAGLDQSANLGQGVFLYCLCSSYTNFGIYSIICTGTMVHGFDTSSQVFSITQLF